MLRQIILGVAIVAAVAAVVVNVTVVRQKIGQLTDDRNTQRSEKETALAELAATNRVLVATQQQLTQTQQQLTQTEAARDTALHQLAAANTQIQDLNTKLAKTTQERDNAENQLEAFRATGLTPLQVTQLRNNLTDTQQALAVANQEKAVLTRAVTKLNFQIEELIGSNVVVTLPANLKGTVMAVDPKWDFVVLNIGADQGALQDGEMLVSRDGKLVAKVVIRSVQKDRCIANVVPGWQLGDIMEGDEAIPAHPASS
jgi:FtsZ-interacting cell division protein ZipA